MAPEDYDIVLLGTFEEEKFLIISLKLLIETRGSLVEFIKCGKFYLEARRCFGH